ncbi:MAG TPA: TIGR01777 family oxidoreductase [Gemmatimonadaceae bacterium]|nr:TIGR01777 family oxidoreductase [Gemmatimonadaceae bacterium]
MPTVLLSGASGFIGSRLRANLVADGHRVVALTGRRTIEDHVWWDAATGRIDDASLARVQPDVVVNLAGEAIDQRWTRRRRERIRDSRVNGTAALARAVARLSSRPRLFVSGSAVGYYGARRGDETLTEDSAPGDDFLAKTARAWEAATIVAADAGIRVVLLRTGVVIGASGGALRRLITPFRLGLGGRLGDGMQWMSWVALDDVVGIVRYAMRTDTLRGAVNVVAPDPVRNAEFTRILARVLSRPAILPVPRIALEIAFGTMADNTILASQRVTPKRLADAGFEFRHPRLEEALRAALRRSGD